jgi:hypothetical protein
MKIQKSIQHAAFVFLISAELIYSQDFKIAPNTQLPEGSNFYNVSVASDTSSGFLVTWINTYLVGSVRYFQNYACRISKTGEMLDSIAIFLCESYWSNYCPTAVFAGGNWIIAMNRGGLFESVGVMRLTASGALLDSEPVNILQSTGMATIEYPTLATNGREILCLSGVAGDSLRISIFDPDLNILVDRLGLFPGSGNVSDAYINYEHPFGVVSNGDNFYITFLGNYNGKNNVKLIVVNSKGKILSTQTVFENFYTMKAWGVPAITAVDSVIYITYFNRSTLYLRRYNAVGTPVDPSSVQICEFEDFNPILTLYAGGRPACGYMDWIFTNETFFLFWPKAADQGISMLNFKPDFSAYQIYNLNSQCQYDPGDYTWEDSFSYIQAASMGNKVLTAWIDGREGDSTRVYGNFFDVDLYTGVKQQEDQRTGTENFSIFQNYPNPFNPETTICYQLHEPAIVTLEVYNAIGKLICTLVNQQQPVGLYFIRWNGNDEEGATVASGVYFCKLKAGRFVAAKKMLVVR